MNAAFWVCKSGNIKWKCKELWTIPRGQHHANIYAIEDKGSGKLIDTMANVSIFSGNFFHLAETKKHASQMMVNNF